LLALIVEQSFFEINFTFGKKIYIKTSKFKRCQQNYLSWFSRSNLVFIEDVKNKIVNLKYLKEHTKINNKQNKILFIGIFEKKDLHIGNLKFHDVSIKNKIFNLGIWIGNIKF